MAITPEQLKKLEKKIKDLNTHIDGVGDDLVDAITKYQRAYEQYLREQKFKLTPSGTLERSAANFTKAASLSPMEKLGFNSLAVSHIRKYDDLADNQIAFNKSIGIAADLSYKDITVVNYLKDIDLADMFMQGQTLDGLVKKQLVNAIALGTDYQTAVSNLATDLLGSGPKLGSLARYADTYMRTSLFSLSRTVDKAISDKIGGDTYVYAGPIDKHTREFCVEHAGNEYTTEEINKFGEENGSGLDGFASPGGWNCRHRMIKVSGSSGSSSEE